MKLSDLPIKINIPWAAGESASYVREIPDGSQSASFPGVASWTDGFPAICFTAKASGGLPPAGQDFNGAFRRLSQWIRYIMAAGVVPYDATWQTANGGYPLNAVVSTSYTGATGTTGTLGRVYISVVDGNTTNPDTGGAGWTYLALVSDIAAQAAASGITSFSNGLATFTAAGSATFTATYTGLHRVTGWGGGAGGGFAGTSTSAGGGGGAGGCGYTYVYLTKGQTYPLIVGAGGAGGTSASTQPTAGGTTSFNGVALASGGSPGVNAGGSGQAAAGGAGGNGQVTGTGRNFGTLSGTQGYSTSPPLGGAGGSALNGGGSGGPLSLGGGNPGVSPGGGGGGAANSGNSGGNGAPGAILIEF